MKTKAIIWTPRKIKVSDIKPIKNNYKIKTDLGRERLQTSLKMFGLAGTVICNTDLMLIDGDSRLKEAKEKKEKYLWVSLPDRKLNPKEVTEMTAMYDFAKAGEVDEERIKKDLGTSKDFKTKWGMVPKETLDQLGAKAPVEKVTGKRKEKEVTVDKARIITLIFKNEKEEREFRDIELKLLRKYKTTSTTDTVMRALKSIKV